jgi:hypothetical protein
MKVTYVDLRGDELDVRCAMMSNRCPCALEDHVVRCNSDFVCDNDLHVHSVLDLFSMTNS